MTKIENLKHHTIRLKGNGKIVVLDSGAVLSAEMTSMLQALHSRSTGGIDAHLQVLAERGADKFMKTYYVGYGHKSIGDCGVAVVFIEGVSMLAAKAIQDYPLYNGQEASTRYIAYDEQPIIDPIGSTESKVILETWRQFYLKAVEKMKAELPNRYPMEEGEKETIYNNAINARAFDICRGFLPAGTSTNLAWTTTLRQFADRIVILRNHPLQEVQEIAEKLEDALIEVYPNSFEKVRYEKTENYLSGVAKDLYYYHDPESPEMKFIFNGVNVEGIKKDPRNEAILRQRPLKTEIPKWFGMYGTASFAWSIDFGSFRDVQRHRAVSPRMPLLTSELGFHSWYLDELTESLRMEAKKLIESQRITILNLVNDKTVQQYYLPMGYRVSHVMTGDLPALTYLVELRASSKVHPTLAFQAEKMAKLLEEEYGDLGLKIHIGEVTGRFDVSRGKDTITRIDSE